MCTTGLVCTVLMVKRETKELIVTNMSKLCVSIIPLLADTL